MMNGATLKSRGKPVSGDVQRVLKNIMDEWKRASIIGRVGQKMPNLARTDRAIALS